MMARLLLRLANAHGKQMQFFGARANSPSACSTAINGGRDELPASRSGRKLISPGRLSDFDDVAGKFERMMEWWRRCNVNAMNVIHYMHDKYAYERIEMGCTITRRCAHGVGHRGLSVVADSLSAMRHARVKVTRDETGLVVDYQTREIS